MASSSKKKHYDTEAVKDAARNHWAEILARLGGIDPNYLTEGTTEYPCPKCGSGETKFRFTNMNGDGSCHCHCCEELQGSDGLAALMGMKGWDFPTALAEVAQLMGVKPTSTPKAVDNEAIDPAEKLEFLEWHEGQAYQWCELYKRPITTAALKRIGARRARYRDQFTVLAIPAWGEQLTAAEPIGWCLYNITGSTLPKYSQDTKTKEWQVEWVKIKLSAGSKGPGIIGPVDELAAATRVHKLEGPSDLLTFYSLPDVPAGHIAITNKSGAKEQPADWQLELLAGKLVDVTHDADEAGEAGAIGYKDKSGRHHPGWGELAANHATEVRHVRLPYEITKDHGADFRDWVLEGNSYVDLQGLAENAPVVMPVEPLENVLESAEDPHRLARINLERYAKLRTGATLGYWHKEWFKWIGPRWAKIDEAELRAKVTAAVKEEFNIQWRVEYADWKEKRNAPDYDPDKDKGPPVCRKVPQRLISDVMHAMAGMVIIPNSQKLDSWINETDEELPERNCISMANGILDIDKLLANDPNCLLEHSPKWFSEASLPYEFDASATCPKLISFLNKNLEKDQQRIDILQEWAGYLLMRSAKFHKFLFMEGEGSNGKSVFNAVIEAFIGQSNTSHVGLDAFSSEFRLYETLGKLVNIVTEVSEMDSVGEGNLKAYVSGDIMSFNRKGLRPIETNPTARLMISSNTRPWFSDKSQGLWRRMLIIPWRIKITDTEKILGMDTIEWWKKSRDLPGILSWAVIGLHRLLKNNKFTESKLLTESLQSYQHDVNPTKCFLDNNYRETKDTDGDNHFKYVRCSSLYAHYENILLGNGNKALSERMFGREVARTFPNVKRVRIKIGDERSYVYRGLEYHIRDDEDEGNTEEHLEEESQLSQAAIDF